MSGHRHILPLLGSQIVDGKQCLVSPLCSRGDLYAFMESNLGLDPLERLRLVSTPIVHQNPQLT